MALGCINVLKVDICCQSLDVEDIIIDPKLPRRRKLPRSLDDGCPEEVNFQNPKEFYRP